MGFFSKILDKLGFDAGNSKVEEMLHTPIPAASTAAVSAAPGATPVTPMREVDVVAQLEQLGCPASLMGDSAQMNMWLHKTVLTKLAANGGNVPKELLD